MGEADSAGGATAPQFTPNELRTLAKTVRGRNGMRNRQAIELEKRVEYFKGEKLVKFLVETGSIKGGPQIDSEDDAIKVCHAMLVQEYFHRSEKKGKGELAVSRKQTFEKDGYYTWMFQGNQAFSNFLTGLIIVGFLVITCFPIWPQFLKVWMWYASVTMLVFMLSFLMIRFLLWFFMWCSGYEFWLLPRLFDESLGFCESFVPVYSFDEGSPGQGYFRIAALCGIISFFYWAYTQPTDFDSFITAQRDFVSDLYEGNLLSDMSQESKENIDKPKVQSLEEILRELEEEPTEGDEVSKSNDESHVIDNLLDKMFDDDEEEDEEAGEAQAATEDKAEK
ncbi:unnamed protein product [Chrysoparadoxa australica]